MNVFLLATEAVPDRSLAFTATVVIAGIGIVLATLAVLIVIFNIFGNAVHRSQERAKQKQREKLLHQMEQDGGVPEPVKVKSGEVPPPPPLVFQGVTPEVVAAISAAVYLLDGERARVTAIRRKSASEPSRSAWAQAAVLDNTRPF